jgi:HSP20 family protein
MTLIKYSPANQIDTLFDRLSRDMWPMWNRGVEREAEGEELRLPRTNITETEKDYVFTVEMPGLSKKDVEVRIESDTLIVRGEKTEKTEKNEGKEHIRREIRSTRFERSFYLGGNVDADAIKATMDDGVLTVTLSKRPEKVGRKIDIS